MDENYTQEYEDFELRHWWFVVRRQILQQVLDRYANSGSRWLDVGCGTGVLLNSYGVVDRSRKIGLELDPGAVARARQKGLDVRQSQRDWDFSACGEFDLITLTDVIEHVEKVSDAIGAVRGALRDGGVLVITVPALMSLWSAHDIVNHHFRRYTKSTLLELFPQRDWEVLKVSYFSSLLLPLIWAARKWKNLRTGRLNETSATHDFKFGRLDWLFRGVFALERHWLKVANFPLGSSLLLVLRKKPGLPARQSKSLADRADRFQPTGARVAS